MAWPSSTAIAIQTQGQQTAPVGTLLTTATGVTGYATTTTPGPQLWPKGN